MRERCLRTALISEIDAPDASRARVSACFSASDRPAAGAIQLADAPPDISTTTRSSGPAESASDRVSKVAAKSGRIGDRMAGFDHLHMPGRTGIAVPRDRKPAEPARGQAAVVEIMPFRDLGHRAGGLAGGEDEQPSGPGRRRQMRRQAIGGVRGGHRGVEQAFQEGAA